MVGPLKHTACQMPTIASQSKSPRHDVIVTFNYDVVLERTLEYVGKPYRLYPERFKSIGPTFNVVDSDVEEVTVLKLHGSLDWFSNRWFRKTKNYLEKPKCTSDTGTFRFRRSRTVRC